MVVTARAVDRETDERLPDRADDLLEFILPRGFLHELAAAHDRVVQPGDEEADRLLPGWVTRLEHVASDLHPHKLVVRHVVVQRADHPVAIRPEVVADVVPLETVALSEPREIQPVPAPAFAVVRRAEEVVDHAPIGGIGWVGHERRDLLRRGWQAAQVKIKSANQRSRIRWGAWHELFGIQPIEDERIDRVGHPVLLRDRRLAGALHRLERPPVVPAALGRGELKRVEGIRRAPLGPGCDPVVQHLFLRLAKRLIRRHVVAGHLFPKQTLARFPGHHRRAVFAALGGAGLLRQVQLALEVGAVVTLETLPDEDRGHVAVKLHVGSGKTGG